MSVPHLIKAGPYTIEGVSVGGVYTALAVPELGITLDCGIALRSFAPYDHLFLSHTHIDHVGGLIGLLGIRDLMGRDALTVYAPMEAVKTLQDHVALAAVLGDFEPKVTFVAMEDGLVRRIHHDIWVKAFKTHHAVPSLGYQFSRRVQKLRDEFVGLPSDVIGAKRRAGTVVTSEHESLELAYCTDTTPAVWKTNPYMFDSKVIVHECTYADPKRVVPTDDRRCHTHLRDFASAPYFDGNCLVLMHFSQAMSPNGTIEAVEAALPGKNVVPFIDYGNSNEQWFG